MTFTKETFKRALRTFVQAAIAYIVANIALVDFSDKSILKSAVIGLITSALAAGIAAVMNLEKPEQLGGTSFTFDSWVKTYLGKKTDYDGAYGVQCVDLIDCFIDKVLSLKIGFWGNAKDWWNNRNNSTWLKNNFDFITPKFANGELKPGDIGIRTSGTYGHIFIVAEVNKDGKFKYYDQNATGNGDQMTLREKPYTSAYINGVLRPKDQNKLGIEVVKYDAGNKYQLTAYINVWTKPTTSSSIKKVKDLTADGRAHASSKNLNDNATLVTGTVVSALSVSTDTAGNIWLQIPSGYIPVYYKGNKRAVLYNK